MSHFTHGLSLTFLGALAAATLLGGCHREEVGATPDPLTAVCLDQGAPVPAGGWACGEEAVFECTAHEGAYPDYIYVSLPSTQACGSATYTVVPGPFPVGEHTIDVTVTVGAEPAQAVCSSVLVVRDTQPPAVTPRVVELWPPNHKYHHLTPADCLIIADACDAAPTVWFTSASSDEPDDDLGDGSTTGDIAGFACDGVDLRAEREGGSDGRVYTLGWAAEDHAGNRTTGTCQVVVPHDQGKGAAVDSGEDHRVDLDDAACAPSHEPPR